jgi:CheY-like chemotaxis protein
MAVRILIIEDNPENLELMSYLLKAYGYETVTATDGEQGLEMARRILPHLILCDIQIPKLDGFEVVRRVRQESRLSCLTTVAVTAYAMRGDRDKVLAAGFDGYIPKPIEPEDFVSQVEAFLGPNRQVVAPPVTSGLPSEELQPNVNGYRARILIVDNSPVNLALICSTLSPFGFKVEGVRTVKEGFKILQQRPPDLIMSDLHMPDTDGWDFLRTVQADPDLKKIPFVMVSSTIWRDIDPGLAVSRGARKFILRPIEPQALVAEIEDCLRCPEETPRANNPGY